MHIDFLRLVNFGPFRGVHQLSFEAIPYAITATKDDDPERSNFCGKSSLLEAVLLVLYGVHRHRFEDGWISKGEKSGEVALTMGENGGGQWLIERTRTLGAATKLSVKYYDSVDVLQGEEAQKKIEELVGLSLEDFRTTNYFAQKEVSGMVSAQPSARTVTVARWLRLDPLERCAVSVLKKGVRVEQELAGVRGKLSAAKEREERDRAELAGLSHAGDLLTLEGEVAEWEELLVAAREHEVTARAREEKKQLEAEGKQLLVEHKREDGDALKAALIEAQREEADAGSAWQEARTTKTNRVTVASGAFGGTCPVAGIACPATDEINNLGAAARKEAKKASDVEEARRKVFVRAQEAREVADLAVRTRQQRTERLRMLQDRFRAIVLPDTPPGTRTSLQEAQAGRDGAVQNLDRARRILKGIAQSAGELTNLAAKEEMLGLQVAVCREAAAIFGRQGAQRRLAEGVIGEVTARANDMLASAGVELSLECSWERPGKGAADDCHVCGSAYPASVKVKTCAGCGAERRGKTVQQFDVELSARSGAAEDLAGLALSLSAGRFLRNDRGSPWSTVFLDEVGAALDKSHRRALSAHLPALLASAHVEQAFVVSHDSASLASLPGRIAITSDGQWAKVVVE